MREIGTELKQERLKQNLTLEDVSEKTAFSIAQLTALEEGNLDFFKDDITYVKFFVQNYCKILQVDYAVYKAAFDESMLTYTNMLTQKEIEEIRKTNEDIKYKAKLQRGGAMKRKRRGVDLSVLSMLLVSAIMVVGVFYILSNYVLPSMVNRDPSKTTKPTVIIDDPVITTAASTSQAETPGLSVLVVNQLSLNEFEVSGFKEGDIIQIGIDFHHRTWIDVKLDGKSFENPRSKIYLPKESIVYEFEAKAGSEVALNLGYYDTNVFTINGKVWALGDSLAKSRSGQVVKLRLKGDS